MRKQHIKELNTYLSKVYSEKIHAINKQAQTKIDAFSKLAQERTQSQVADIIALAHQRAGRKSTSAEAAAMRDQHMQVDARLQKNQEAIINEVYTTLKDDDAFMKKYLAAAKKRVQAIAKDQQISATVQQKEERTWVETKTTLIEETLRGYLEENYD